MYDYIHPYIHTHIYIYIYTLYKYTGISLASVLLGTGKRSEAKDVNIPW